VFAPDSPIQPQGPGPWTNASFKPPSLSIPILFNPGSTACWHGWLRLKQWSWHRNWHHMSAHGPGAPARVLPEELQVGLIPLFSPIMSTSRPACVVTDTWSDLWIIYDVVVVRKPIVICLRQPFRLTSWTQYHLYAHTALFPLPRNLHNSQKCPGPLHRDYTSLLPGSWEAKPGRTNPDYGNCWAIYPYSIRLWCTQNRRCNLHKCLKRSTNSLPIFTTMSRRSETSKLR